MKNKLSIKEKLFLYIACAVVLAAIFDWIFLAPVLNKMSALNESISQLQSTIERDLKFLSSKDQILQETQVVSKYLIEGAKDDDVVNAAFLQTIENLAQQAHVTLTKSQPRPVENEHGAREYYVALECRGQIKDVMAFMHSINSSEELLKIVGFNMAPHPSPANQVTVSMN